MPSVTITGGSSPINFSVEDKADAIRQISPRLLSAASRSSVEKVLNEWLASSMKRTLKLKLGSESLQITYND